ncbi:MAG: aminotransferase class I/II-fold pyridoxal phosphate-dependent enzyme [Proteobacteria bacterium]|nr:aminotransferase class I/II-fold pyridoxal phosphate-dependent enzyme [Pseudomonadota bacterium]
MKKRLKRFQAKEEKILKTTLILPSGEYEGYVIDISLNAVSFVTVAPMLDLSDEPGIARIETPTQVFEIGKVVVVRSLVRSEELRLVKDEAVLTNKSSVIVYKTLKDHIPLEHLMRYLEAGGDSPYQFELAHGRYTLADFYAYAGSDDILEKTRLLWDMQESWRKKESYQYERYRLPSVGKRVVLDRSRPDGRHDYIAFGSNDYLGFAAHPEVIKTAQDALASYGVGATGSPVSTGLSEEHRKLNVTLKNIFQKQESLLYNSGYTANVGILGALCRDKDLVLHDRLCHASIVDGLVFASAQGATVLPFKHNDPVYLEAQLKEHRSKHKGCLIVTEGIFSMDGYIADLARIVPLARKYNARIFLDVAHDFGVLGQNGLGAAEYHGVLNDIDIIMGTFSKIAGSIGGFVVSSVEVIEYLRLMSRPHIFSVAIPPCIAAATNKALEIFMRDKSYLHRLQHNIRYFAKGLRSLGLPIDPNHQSTICAVVIGDEAKLEKMTGILYDHGLFPTPVVYPVVSRDRSRFRFTITALHDQSDIDYALLVIKFAMKEVGLELSSAAA